MKKVSIVIPLYKSEVFLPKLIESLTQQTYDNLEIIFVDDGSPDNSGIIADNYAQKDSRIRVIHKENGGTCEARNIGLSQSTGDYLMFVDGDDWLELDCVQYLVDILERNDADMSMTDSIFTTRDRVQNERDDIRVWNNKEAVAGIINTFIIPVGPWNKLYSMKIVKENNIDFSVPWFGEGLYFSTMAAMYSSKVSVGHRKIYNYRLNNPNSGCTKKEVKNGINSLKNIHYIKEKLIIDSKDISEALNWHIWANNLNLIMYISASGERKEYKKELGEAKKCSKELLPVVLKHEKLSNSDKMKAIIKTIFPMCFAKYSTYKLNVALKKDLMR